VLYTLISVKHFLQGEEALPWWEYTSEGKKLLASFNEGERTELRASAVQIDIGLKLNF